MDDALVVGRFQRISNLTRHGKGLVHGHRTLRDPIGQRRTLDEFEYEGQDARCFLESVDRANMRVVERRQDLRFPFEAGKAIAIEREDLRENFDGDVAIQPRVTRAVDFAMPPAPRGIPISNGPILVPGVRAIKDGERFYRRATG